MPYYSHLANGRIKTNLSMERKLLSEIQKHLPNSYICTSESRKLTLVLPSKHTLALVDSSEVYEGATFVYSMSSARNAAGVAANVKRKLSSLLQQMQDNEVEKS